MKTNLMTRLTVPTLLAVSALLIFAAAAAADSQKLIWSGLGQVAYVGPSIDPSTPIASRSSFKVKRNGEIQSVEIRTSNEQFVALLGGGSNDRAITECKPRATSDACSDLNALLTGALLTSFHDSFATLSRVTQSEIEIPIVSPHGQVVLNIPVLHGSLRGSLRGEFTLSNANGSAVGSSTLKIGNGSSGTYGCFAESSVGLLPLESLQSCIDNSGGQLFPIMLDVKDSGTFELGHGTGAFAEIHGIKGRVGVEAQSNLLLGKFGGTVTISNAVTELSSGKEKVKQVERSSRGNSRSNGHGNSGKKS